MEPSTWQNIQGLVSRNYTCGYCGMPLASEKGWLATKRQKVGPGSADVPHGAIYICHQCHSPTFFDLDAKKQTPGVTFGSVVKNVTDASLSEIYEEARSATSAGCYTAAVLCCRKLLMHLAVGKGAKPGQSFKSYVEFLADNNHVPSDCKVWITQIKDSGNEANHEIKMMNRDEAEELVEFCEMLLKIFFEYKAAALARGVAKATN